MYFSFEFIIRKVFYIVQLLIKGFSDSDRENKLNRISGIDKKLTELKEN